MEILVFCLGYLILAYKRIDWALLLLFVLLPTYLIRFELYGLPFTLLEAMILIAFFVWFFKNREQQFGNIKKSLKILFVNRKSKIANRIRYPFDIEISLLLIVSLVAVGVSGFGNDALGVWKAYFFEPILVFILVLNIFQERKNFRKIIYALAVSAFLLSCYAIFQKFTGIGINNEFWRLEEGRRVTSVFPYPNALALFLAPLILVFLGEVWSVFKEGFEKIKKVKNMEFAKIFFLSSTIAISGLSVFFAKSEGALVALAVAGFIYLVLVGRKWRYFAGGVLIGSIFFVAFAPTVRNFTIEKLTLNDLSGEIRKQQWRETWQLLESGQKNFILGTGLLGYKEAIGPFHQEGIFFNSDKDPDFRRKIVLFNEEYKSKYWQPVEIYLYPHNIFLNFWTELGIVGMLLFVWIVGKYLYLSIQNSKFKIQNSNVNKEYYLNLGLLGAMMVIIIHGLVDVPYFKNDLAVLFWFLVAMLSLINLHIKYEKGITKKHS